MSFVKKGFKRLAAVLLAAAVMSAAAAGTTMPAVQAMEPMKTCYGVFGAGVGWSRTTEDNQACRTPPESFVTALKAALVNQPEGMSGTISYQVNLSGYGWLDWTENNAQTGVTDRGIPLEALRMSLTGELTEHYDLYYSVLENGSWTPWSMNGETAGVDGAGLCIAGIRISVVDKGAGEPEIPEPEPLPTAAAGVDPSRPMVALTFDDGPNAAVTNRILDSLEIYGGHATFFMVGNRVTGKANMASVQRMAALGCQVGGHTYEHKTITKLGDAAIRLQLGMTNQNVAAASGVSPVVMRPPGGAYDAASLKSVGAMGMSAILWSIDTRDWETRSKQKTVDAVLNQVKDGDIILMHDLYGSTADAAEVIIPELTRRGYQLVTVSEMAESRGGLVPGRAYRQFRP